MALPLEQTIMTEIGLGSHYSWYNGSGGCGYIRCKAVEQLPEVIKRHADAGEEIVEPDQGLMDLAKRLAGSPYVRDSNLTDVWKACSYIIRRHIEAFHAQPGDRQEMFSRMAEYITSHYMPLGPTSIHMPRS